MDDVTLEMVRLLTRRSRLADRIGKEKQRMHMRVDDGSREDALRSKVIESCQSAADGTMASRLLNFLLNESVMIQSETSGMSHISVFQEAKRLESEGKSMIHMEVGEPDSAPSAAVSTALADACKTGHTKYGSSLGMTELRDAIASVESEHGHNVIRDNVLVTMGARFAVYLAIGSLLVPGDEIIVIEPAWPAYRECAMRAGVKVRTIRTTLESSWEPDMAEIKSAITPNTKMIVLNYPNNPTGKTLPKPLLSGIMDAAKEHSMYVLSDEIYSAYSREKYTSVMSYGYERTIAVQSLSKSHAMTGFRIGYAVASPDTIRAMAALQSLCVICAPTPIQYAALAALQDSTPRVADSALTRLAELEVMASESDLEFTAADGAMYVFARLPGSLECADIVSECLKRGLAVAPGSGFGAYDDHIRLSACADTASIRRGMNIINSVIIDKLACAKRSP